MIRIRMTGELMTDIMFMKYAPQTLIVEGIEEEYPITDISMDEKGIITIMLDDGKEEVVDQILEYRRPSYALSNKDCIEHINGDSLK